MVGTLMLLTALVGVAIVLAQPSPERRAGLPTNGLIAFDSGGDIWLANPDGTEPRRLTDSPATEHTPIWSPDGRKLAYTVDGERTADIVVTDPDGGNLVTIARAVPRDPFPSTTAPWSPDSVQFLYSARVDGRNRVFVANADGSGYREIGDPSLDAKDPAWSPDGTSIAFTGRQAAVVKSGVDGPDWPLGVYLMAPDGTHVRALAPVEGFQEAFDMPMWSPDSSSVVAYAPGDNLTTSDIWVFPADGSPARNISHNPASDWWPTWSPDGRVAYVRQELLGQQMRPVIVEADGSGEIVIDAPPLEIRPVIWSADGAKLLAYLDPAAGTEAFVVIDPDAGTSQVIPAPGADWGGGWQPIR
jgi:TolB protein